VRVKHFINHAVKPRPLGRGGCQILCKACLINAIKYHNISIQYLAKTYTSSPTFIIRLKPSNNIQTMLSEMRIDRI